MDEFDFFFCSFFDLKEILRSFRGNFVIFVIFSIFLIYEKIRSFVFISSFKKHNNKKKEEEKERERERER